MPVSLLIALFLAFGTDAILPSSPVPRSLVWPRLMVAMAEVGLVGLSALGLASAVVMQVRRTGRPTSSARRTYAIGSKAVGFLTLGGFAWIIHGLGWPEVVRSGLGLRDWLAVDDLLILLPFLLAQVAGWWGLYPAERALTPSEPISSPFPIPRPPVGIARHLFLRVRQSLGMVLPSALIFSLAQDVSRRWWPETATDPGFQVAMMAAMGALVLALAPAFVRLSWPTRTLPRGPFRDRLERLASRFGFRFTDILIWETDGTIVNAGVTGALPWFRYVLLTDALIDELNPHEVAAVFGHEVGHVKHRHLGYFGFFLVASLGVLALASDVILGREPGKLGLGLGEALGLVPGSQADSATRGIILVVLGAGYFATIFGLVSRIFERQADVFGCRAVSCGNPDCPPHPDLYARADPKDRPSPDAPLCPVGIRTFINALKEVAAINGIDPTDRSWRHGSIANRVAFLERLEGQPRAETRFQANLGRMKIALAVVLILGLVLAFRTGAIEHLGP